MPLSPDQMIKSHGSEYPDAVVFNGVRMPLVREGRFQRVYENSELKRGTVVSRFMDGTAEITLSELQELWPTWTWIERHDFTNATRWLHEHAEFPEILRYMLDHGNTKDFCAIALSVSKGLPKDEAFARLSNILDQIPIDRSVNITQAIAHTKHPDALDRLREHLPKILSDPRLMEPADSCHEVTYAAACCIEHLILLNAPPDEFETHVRQLNDHSSARLLDWVRRRLSKYYPWLGEPEPLPTF